MTQLTNVDEILAALGGPTKVASLTGYKWASTAANWRRDGLPSKTYVVLQDALAKAGYTAPASLWGMIEPKDRAEIMPSEQNTRHDEIS